MTRQQRIPNTDRPDHPDVEKVCLDYVAVRDERCTLSQREAQKKLEMGAILKARGLVSYRFYDAKAGRYRVAKVEEGKPQISVVDTDDTDGMIGEGASEPTDDTPPGNVPAGLIAQAEKAQADANVEETADGDVEVPDTAAPKAKRGRKAKTS